MTNIIIMPDRRVKGKNKIKIKSDVRINYKKLNWKLIEFYLKAEGYKMN